MKNLAEWIETNFGELTTAAVAELSQDEALKSQVTESVEAFFDALLHAAKIHNLTPLNVILIDWVESRSAPTDAEVASLIPVLATLKQATWRYIVERCSPNQAIPFLTEVESLFTNAIVYLSQLEGDAL